MKKHVKKILKEMCKRVNANFDKFNFKTKDWFMKHEWSEEECDKFKEWLIIYLNENKEARTEIMNIPLKNKIRIEKTAGMFILNYAWRTKWDGMNKKKKKK